MPIFETAETPTKVRSSTDETTLVFQGRATLDQFYAAMRDFSQEDLSEVLAKIAAYAAYAAELRGRVVRSESRRLQAFRTRELDPFLDQCEFQFKVWSRYQSVRQMEYDVSRGGV